MRFEGSRKEAAKLCIVFALFTSLYLWIAIAANISRYPPILYKTLGVISAIVFIAFFVVSLIWLIWPTHITVRKDGFTITQFRKTTGYAWADIQDIWTKDSVFVIWTSQQHTHRPIWLRWFKGDAILWGLWAVSVNEIAWEMKRHLAAAR